MNREYHAEDFLEQGEEIVWRGKVKQNATLSSEFFNILPFMLVWLAAELFIISFVVIKNIFDKFETLYMWMLIGAAVLHLIPVAFWVKEVLHRNFENENNEYVLTNNSFVIVRGKNSVNYQKVPLASVNDLKMKRSFGQMLMGCADYTLVCDDEIVVLPCVDEGYTQYMKVAKLYRRGAQGGTAGDKNEQA